LEPNRSNRSLRHCKPEPNGGSPFGDLQGHY
jgi:hypothetical protein